MSEKSITFKMAGDREITISTGKLARLANGSCTVKQGDTIVFSAACSGKAKENADFLPLQVDYREKYSASGIFPGGFIKRENRPSDREILICRMADRPLRPLFPNGYFDEVQVQSTLLSADFVNEPDVLSILSASVALTVSDLPFEGPIGALRVALIDGKFIANPTIEEIKKSSLELIYAGLADKIIMIEGDAKELDEETFRKAFEFANEQVKIQIDAQLELAKLAGKKKSTPKLYTVPAKVKSLVTSFCQGKLDEDCFIPGKEERNNALKLIFTEMLEKARPEFAGQEEETKLEFHLRMAFDAEVQKTIRDAILIKGKRSDGRTVDDLRSLHAETGFLPRPHGTGLFERGETQALVMATLGSPKDAQESDSIVSPERLTKKTFFLHYNFPNYSVGEVGRIAGPGRREIGHGNLAERSLLQVMPDKYPYTVRCVSEIMGSNGSTSMASICGGSLALMDAGVPIKGHVAGISCGLIKEGEKAVLLADIIGAEDHYGDMDFKVAGTKKGITGFQLDLKIPGISIDLIMEGMYKNKTNREKILDVLYNCISSPKTDLSPFAPRIHVMKISTEKIGALIGPGGKIIKGICELTGAQIDVKDDGTVTIFATNKNALETALDEVNGYTAEVEIGKIYRGKVTGIKEFGVFVEFLPNQEGLVHISELADYRVNNAEEICKLGDKMTVKVVGFDVRGKIKLSRKAALAEIK
ncbi:MAG TPA: polyribonucleotide nucleotidyltransferase [Lentisphaeria bacterium]|nr:MAG: polyribonucleotide nucleotidyltransferase [Lentisphaerae bacterium GWF2_38_69]HBM16541.1 polyribonucleotide nucleotidyltransferase [Lentisphaeria bacterium]